MAKAKSEAGFDRELYKKLHEAVVKGNITMVQSLLQTFTKDEAKSILDNRYSAHDSVPLLNIAIRNRHTNLVQLLVNHYDVSVDYTDLKPPESASKELLEHGMLQNANERHLTPLDLACLEGSVSIVEFLLDNLSANDTERANCFELLASSILLKNGLTSTHINKMENYLDTPHYFLNKAMMIRHSHNPPLLKQRKQDSLETVLHQLETQTLEELVAIKTNRNGLITELLFARQRTLGVELYNDHLLPFMGKCIDFKINEQLCNKDNGRRDNHDVVVLLVSAFRLQRKSLDHPNCNTLKERIEWLDKVCRLVKKSRTVNISVFGAILDSIEEFYKCRNSENAHMPHDTYALLLNFLKRIITNDLLKKDECIDIKALTKRFLRLTRNSLAFHSRPSFVMNLVSHCDVSDMNYCYVCRRNVPHTCMFVTGDNVLHVACRKHRNTSCNRNMFKVRGLAKLLQTLHACGEDVNAQNSDGQTPLQVFVSDHRLTYHFVRQQSMYYSTGAIRSLLLAGANPDLRDKSKRTSLHAAMNGYALIFRALNTSYFDLKVLNSIVELLLKSGANPNARDSRSFSPLHVLMNEVFLDGNGYNPQLVRQTGDQFANKRQSLHEVVQIIQRYGGSAHATTNDGRSVFDMCKDDELLEKMSQDIPVTSVHLTLSQLAAAAIRKHQVQYHDKLPRRLIEIVEVRD